MRPDRPDQDFSADVAVSGALTVAPRRVHRMATQPAQGLGRILIERDDDMPLETRG
jgi:hypothetical protein